MTVSAAVVLAVVVAVLALRVPDPPPVSERMPPAEQVGPDEGQAAPARRMVALGDFWAAGPGLSAVSQPSAEDEQCGRSAAAHPQLVAAELDLQLIDRTCVGAGPEDVGRGGRTDAGLIVAPQVDALSRRTDIVTVSVGAEHDDLLDGTVTACQELASSAPQGAPCRRVFGEDGLDEVRRDAATAGRLVEMLLREIARRAPGARLLVVGYANPFPAGASCFDRSGVADGDIAYLREAVALVVDATRAAAREAGAAYVDPEPAFAGHQLCSRSPYVARGLVGGPVLRLTARGHRAVAEVVADSLAEAGRPAQ